MYLPVTSAIAALLLTLSAGTSLAADNDAKPLPANLHAKSIQFDAEISDAGSNTQISGRIAANGSLSTANPARKVAFVVQAIDDKTYRIEYSSTNFPNEQAKNMGSNNTGYLVVETGKSAELQVKDNFRIKVAVKN